MAQEHLYIHIKLVLSMYAYSTIINNVSFPNNIVDFIESLVQSKVD